MLRLLRLDDDDLLLYRLAHHDLRLLRVVLLRLLRLLLVVPGRRRPDVGLLLLLLLLLLWGLRVVLRLRDDVLRLPAALNVLRLHLRALSRETEGWCEGVGDQRRMMIKNEGKKEIPDPSRSLRINTRSLLYPVNQSPQRTVLKE